MFVAVAASFMRHSVSMVRDAEHRQHLDRCLPSFDGDRLAVARDDPGPASSTAARLAATVQFNVRVAPSSREARLTVSPIAVYSMRSGAPMLPTTARPLWMPTPIPKSGRSRPANRSFIQDAISMAASRSAIAARSARRA